MALLLTSPYSQNCENQPIIIPYGLIRGYIGNITGIFELDFGRSVTCGEAIPDEILRIGQDAARLLQHQKILELSVMFLLKYSFSDLNRFHLGEQEWTDEEMIWTLKEIVRYWFHSKNDLGAFFDCTRIVDVDYDGWKAVEFPEIVKILG